MCGMRGSGFEILHLLRITVISGDEEDITRLLAGLIHNADGFVSVGDGLDGCVEHARMADLRTESGQRRHLVEQVPTISGGAKLHITNSWSPFLTTSATFSATFLTLISGILS